MSGPTRLILAATIGLAAAALGRPLLAVAGLLLGNTAGMRVAARRCTRVGSHPERVVTPTTRCAA